MAQPARKAKAPHSSRMRRNKSPSPPEVTTPPRRYDDIEIEFMGPESDEKMPGCGTYTATVIEREEELVLDLTEHGEPCLIVAKRGADGQYSGSNAAKNVEGAPSISTIFTRLRNAWWVGTWLEEGEDYTIRFRLPPSRK